MSRLDPALALRLDHLAARAHRRHRFAHHPLCAAYAGERIRIGRHHLCRGCLAALAGALAGGGLAGFAPVLGRVALLAVALAGAVLGLAALAWRLPAGGKTVSRGLPAVCAVFVLVQGLRLGGAAGFGLALATCLLVLAGLRLYRRRGPSRTPCLACPERGLAPCSGLRPLQHRERAFQRLAGHWIRRARGPGAPRVPRYAPRR